MIRPLAVALLALSASGAAAFERLGVVAVSDPPSGPDADLAELTHQLRAACRDRIGGVEDVPTMRARFLGQLSNATLSELDRAYGGALAVYQNGEFESALRTLHAIVDDLESLPEGEDAYAQWVRAQLRLAHAALTIARDAEAELAFYALAKTEIGIQPDPEQYSPSYRRRFDGIKAKVRALPARRLTVTSEGAPGTVFVNGRAVGMTPISLWLSAGTYRVGGQAGDLRAPSFPIDLRAEDRSVVLDFALADSLRLNAGPGLALAAPRRGDGVVRAGAWLLVDKMIAVSRAYEGDAAFLLGSIYDVRRGALLREGSVRMVAGSVPAANLGALAAFLLTGQSSRDVKDRTDPARAGAPVANTWSPPAPAAPPPGATRAPAAAPPAASVPLPPPPVPRGASASPAAAKAAASVAPGKGKPAPAGARASVPSRPEPPPAVATRSATPDAAPNAPPSAAPGAAPLAPAPAAPVAAVASVPAVPPPGSPSEARPSLSAPPPRSEPSRRTFSNATPAEPRRWMRPAAIGSGVAAGLMAIIALQQGLASRKAYRDAEAMIGTGGTFVPGSDPERYRALRSDGDAARRNVFVSAGAAAALGVAAGVLGWKSMEQRPGPGLAFRF